MEVCVGTGAGARGWRAPAWCCGGRGGEQEEDLLLLHSIVDRWACVKLTGSGDTSGSCISSGVTNRLSSTPAVVAQGCPRVLRRSSVSTRPVWRRLTEPRSAALFTVHDLPFQRRIITCSEPPVMLGWLVPTAKTSVPQRP